MIIQSFSCWVHRAHIISMQDLHITKHRSKIYSRNLQQLERCLDQNLVKTTSIDRRGSAIGWLLLYVVSDSDAVPSIVINYARSKFQNKERKTKKKLRDLLRRRQLKEKLVKTVFKKKKKTGNVIEYTHTQCVSTTSLERKPLNRDFRCKLNIENLTHDRNTSVLT